MQGIGTIDLSESDVARAGARMLEIIRDLYPICRSITGPGLRATLKRVADVIPLKITEVPTGTRVHDWTVPREWSIEDAYLEHESGKRFVDFRDSNLHVVSYSTPVDLQISLHELRGRLHSLPQHPDWIPFRSSYYSDDWGFCLADRVKQAMPEGMYHAVIRSALYDGSLTLAEFTKRGDTDEEILVFTHTCHPSLCNDNLSGIAVAAEVANHLKGVRSRYSYRFVFAPATIGSIAWLATNEGKLANIRHGLVLAMLGDTRPLRYHRTVGGRGTIDRAASATLKTHYQDAGLVDFTPWGFDERQFNSPGIGLPVGRLTRALPGEYPAEHSSADSLDAISPAALAESWLACLRIVETLEADETYINQCGKGEPQLGRRGLYRKTGGHYDSVSNRHLALLWLLNQSDGSHSLLDIAERSGLDFGLLAACARDLMTADILRKAS